jgi:hypothetical protein
MNKTMLFLTIILAIAMLSSARFKDWVSDRKDWQFVVILTILFTGLILLMLRSFHVI